MKRKKNTGMHKVKDITKYYKATYTNGDEAVFIGKDMNSATLYAMDGNSYGRTLVSVKEYDDMFKALTDYQ
jgi:hypothetical protein